MTFNDYLDQLKNKSHEEMKEFIETDETMKTITKGVSNMINNISNSNLMKVITSEKVNSTVTKFMTISNAVIDVMANLQNKIEVLRDNPKTNEKLEVLLTEYETGVTKIEELETKINELVNDKLPNYHKLNENNISNSLIIKPKANNIQVDDFFNTGTIKVGTIVYKMDNYKELKNSTTKLLVFAIININGYIAEFSLTEYMNFRNIKDRKEATNKIKSDLELLKSIKSLESIKDNYNFECLIIGGNYSKGKVNIKFNPLFAESLKKFYMYIPYELLSINDKYYPHAWTLGYFIFEHARNNKTLSFTLKIETCLKRIDIPSIKEVGNKMDRHFDNKIIKPFESTIDILSESIPDLTIEFENEYQNISEFEKGRIKININNQKLNKMYKGIKNKKVVNSKAYNIEVFQLNKKKAKELHSLGVSTKEISKKLGKTERTIRNYLLQ